MDKTLIACDELTGFIVACSLLRPDGILDLGVSSVTKKLKNPKFAASVSREEIAKGIKIAGTEIGQQIDFIINALRPQATELGLAGNSFDVANVWQTS